jgi:Uma2 family endonuclease
MAMPAVRPDRSFWTVDAVEALPDDGQRREVLHGELFVIPPPEAGHNWIALECAARLRAWCAQHTGWTVLSPGGVYMSSTSWLEPDVAVYAAAGGSRLTWRDLPPPALVVEIASPSTLRRDRFAKRVAYLTHGVAEVWVLDREARHVERWTAASEFPTVIESQLHWAPVSDAPPFEMPLAMLLGE